MKNVAGFHFFPRWALAGILEDSDFLKAFGMIECHTEGRATRGRVPVVVEYAR